MFSQGRIRVILLCLTDIICITSVWTAVVCGYWFLGGRYDPRFYLRFWPVAVFFAVLNSYLDLYHGNWMYPSAPLSPVEEMRRLFYSALVTHLAVIAFLAFAYQTTEGYSRLVIGASGVLTAFAAQSFRNWVRFLMKKAGVGQIPVLLAGGGEAAVRVASVLAGDRHSGFRIAGYFDSGDSLAGLPRLGTLRDIVAEARKRDIKTLLACQDERLFRLQLEEFAGWFTYIEYLPTARTFPVFGSRAVSFDGIGGLEMMNQGRMKVKRIQKRMLDNLFGVFAFIVLSPFFIILPLIIKLTSRGPVFYRQERLGKGGRRIRVWKFRSMYVDADRRLERLLADDPAAADEWRRNFKLRHDPRVTPFGRLLRRTSLDELPQLFNVFSGEMALIGPRPIVEEEVAYYGDSYVVFSSVRPGVTGLWQVSGRSDTDYRRRIALDTYYVLNWSPWMDVWILIRTVYAVVFMRGAR